MPSYFMVLKKTTDQLVQERPDSSTLQTLPRSPINVVVDNIRSLDNVGLLFRLCELARVEKLYLTGYTGRPGFNERHTRRIEKTAVYAVPYQPWEYIEDPVPLVRDLKENGSKIISLEQTTDSVAYHEVEYQLPLTLIIGHERQGVRQELLDLSDLLIDIPILGMGNSHNVATATGIVLYEMLRKTGQITKKR